MTGLPRLYALQYPIPLLVDSPHLPRAFAVLVVLRVLFGCGYCTGVADYATYHVVPMPAVTYRHRILRRIRCCCC